MKVDLHTHTTASDGQYTPKELLQKAKQKGLNAIAITDHDTIDGVKEAVAEGNKFNIKVITGIEFGAKEESHMHILGYGFDFDNAKMNNACDVLKKARDDRKYRLIDFLKQKGINISLKEVESVAGSDLIARPHFAQVMVKHNFVKDMPEAFSKYLDTPDFQKIERFKYNVEECIKIIQNANGKAVLAHPVQLKKSDDELEKTIKMLKEYGLDGLECYYTTHSPEQTKFYLEIAKKYNLNVTAGSDFHGENIKKDVMLFDQELNIDWLL